MLHPGQLQRSAQAEGGEAVAADRAVGAVHAPGQGAVGIHGHHPGLVVVVGLATVAVAEVGLPGVVELPFEIQAGQLGTALGDVEGLVQAPAARDVQRAVGTRVDGRATVERRGELAVLVAQVDRRVLAVPGQRGRHQRLATLAEVAPVILVLMIEDHPVGQSAVAQRAGGVELAAAAVVPVGVGRATQGQGVGLLQLWLLAHHVDHPARVLDAIEQGCWPFSTSTWSAVAVKLRPCTEGMPSRMIEPSRLSPKPRFITASWVPPRVLAWVMPLMLPSASSRLRGRWSCSACAGTTLIAWGFPVAAHRRG